MFDNLSGSQRQNLQEAQIRFALQVADLCERHKLETISVSVRRHEFTDCLNVVGNFAEDEYREAYVPMDIPPGWSEEFRDVLEAMFTSAAQVAGAVVRERRGSKEESAC